jgi:hypothetical protein
LPPLPPAPEEALRLREEADEDRRLDAFDLLLVLLGLLPERVDLLFEPLLFEAEPLLFEAVERLRVEPLAFEPFELFVDRFCLLEELVLVWAIPPLLGFKTPPCNAYPLFVAQNVFGALAGRRPRRYICRDDQSSAARITDVRPITRPTIQPATSWPTSTAPRATAMPTIPPVAMRRMKPRSTLERRRSRAGTIPCGRSP